MKYNVGITVFTPTFNRAYILEKLYKSLLNQTDKSFEWVIVDDGSTDNTKALVDKFIEEKKIDITYVYTENGGKSAAFNKGVLYAKYNLFFCVDSDDYLSDNCVESLNKINLRIKDDKKIVGIIAYRENIAGKNKFVENVKKDYIRLSELYAKYNYRGETALAFKTNLLKENPFPIIKGDKFITESWLYDRLDRIGKSYFLQKVIYYCQYLDDGYTKNDAEIIRKNVKSFIIFSEQRMDIAIYLKTKLKGALYYNVCNIINKSKIKYIFHKHFLLIVATIIPAYIYYLKKFKK
ncbi:MAG: glycosyltransferase family 2 protein [Clostridia bacterium]|nr:glycosyltransferase family 2 protein [Clostridia bacterium]